MAFGIRLRPKSAPPLIETDIPGVYKTPPDDPEVVEDEAPVILKDLLNDLEKEVNVLERIQKHKASHKARPRHGERTFGDMSGPFMTMLSASFGGAPVGRMMRGPR